MKSWIIPLCLALLPAAVQAKSVRIAWSPAARLSAWLDNVPGAQPRQWCGASAALHIEPAGAFSQEAFNDFLPQVGRILAKQCGELKTLRWTVIDKQGDARLKGTASADQKWRVILPPPEIVADATPWQRFALSARCSFRTYWPADGQAAQPVSADGSDPRCDDAGWIQGPGRIGSSAVTFVSGYPLLNAPAGATQQSTQVVSANNQRLILASGSDASSWLLLPWDAAHLAWRFDGSVLIKATPGEAEDARARTTLIDAARQRWALGNKEAAWQLIAALHPHALNPAPDPLAQLNSDAAPAARGK
ncbi:hypothetical protein [Pantoea piersonii]|uniref:hypothetical protein n=1 Tax=Pantoea piersonii TaxID=2364647 RepID=UPI0028AEBB48|nr:hypothetical protein [Pantoea piersonii]